MWLVKCIIIAVLDFEENLVDGVLNYGVLEEARRELQELLSQTDTMQCTLGIPVIGVCL